MKLVTILTITLLSVFQGCTMKAETVVEEIPELQVGAACLQDYIPQLEGKKVALCGNQTSVVGNSHLVDTLLSLNVNLVKLFCPEHGFRGKAEAGAAIASGIDAPTGLPVVSLYGKNKKPTAEQLHDVDVVLFDLQDVGCRFYTYISTLHYVMEAAAENNVKVVVLDRPNPNGFYVDGPILKPEFKSFVGMHKVPIVYGMTIGEYALMINGESWLANGQKCDLQVVKIKNYNHQMRYELPVAPSPNLQTPEAVFLYPSLCLFEGTNISVGRGTETPFEIYGAPNLSDGDYFFTPIAIKGVSENPPHKNVQCRGYNLHDYAKKYLDQEGKFNLQFVINAYKYSQDKDKFFTSANFFDKLAGNSLLRQQIIKGESEDAIRDSWKTEIQEFMAIREKYLLYD